MNNNLISFCWSNPYATYIFSMLVVVFMLNQLDRYLVTVSKIPFIDYDGTQYALIVGPLFTLIFTVCGVAIGPYGETNRVFKLALCLVIWSLATVGNAWSTAFWGVAISRVMLGMGQSGCNPFAVGIIGDYFPDNVRGAAMGVYNIGVYCGYSAALGLGTFLKRTVSWKFPYYVFGFSGCGLAAILMLTVRNKEKNSNNRDRTASRDKTLSLEDGEREGLLSHSLLSEEEGCVASKAGVEAPSADDGEGVNGLALLLKVGRYWLRTPSLLMLCLAGGVRNAGGYVWGSYAPNLFSELYDTYDDQNGACVFSFNSTLPAEGQTCTDEYRYCIDGDCSKLTDTPWLNRGMDSATFESFMSWVPLVCGSIGAVVGGIVSDRWGRSAPEGTGPLARVMVAMLSNGLAAPICALTLFLDTPWCFLSKGLGYVVGEMWIGVTLALVVDLVPAPMRVTSVAIYMFIITNIGGNASILMPSLERAYKNSAVPHVFNITAAVAMPSSPCIGSSCSGVGTAVFTEVAHGSYPLRMALFWLYPALFLGGAVLFGVTYIFLKRDLEKARLAEQQQQAEYEGGGVLGSSSIGGGGAGRQLSKDRGAGAPVVVNANGSEGTNNRSGRR